jgi:hypothetical protein
MNVTKKNIIVGKRSCILCCKELEYVAIISGDSNLEEIKALHKGKEVTDQVVVLKRILAIIINYI